MKKAPRTPDWIAQIPSVWLVAAATGLTLAQFVLAFFLQGPNSAVWEWMGWICLWSAGVFGLVPIVTFRKQGEVKKEDSYIETTRLVTRGLYAIVRHPQNCTAWILINLGMLLIVRHWSSYLTGSISILLAYLDTAKMDQRCIDKFGRSYQEYMKEVPRVNFLRGIFLLIRKR